MEWTAAYINDLPDSCFAYIEPGGKKDAEGKTVPRSLRHLPYRDKDGKPDPDHVRNALARLPQTEIPFEAKREALKKLIAAAKELGIAVDEERYRREYRLAEGKLKIPFLRLGTWQHPRYGVVRVTQDDMRRMQENFRKNVLGRPPFVRLGHDREEASTFGGALALGWVKDLAQEGDVLYAVADPTDEAVPRAVREKKLRFASAEYDPDYVDKESGRRVGPVLLAVALTNEPYLTRLPEVVALADDDFKIYMDYQEVANLPTEELLRENNSLLRKLADLFTGFISGRAATGNLQLSPDGKLTEEERRKLADYDRLKAELEETREKERRAVREQRTAEVEKKLADLVAKGIPPVMCDKAKAILLADMAPATIKLADGQEKNFADLVYDVLEALPAEHRVKLGQVGSQESNKPGGPDVKEVYGDVVPELKGKQQG